MKDSEISQVVKRAFEATGGIFRLAPTWVPRAFLQPGRRLRLNPNHLYALGANRGGIDERWFASTTPADNGPGTPPDEGLSYIVFQEERFLLRDAIAAEGELILGPEMMGEFGGWKVYAKFFDNMYPIPHHLHINDEFASKIGREGKPEGYYFPPQLNTVENSFPYTFFGLEPGTTRADVRRCLERWNEGDNGILELSRAYRLKPGTGWLLPPGILHAPGTLVTFEVQWASDVYVMFESMSAGQPVSRDLLIKDAPPERRNDYDYLLDMIDWEANLDPNFKEHHYLEPKPVAETASSGYQDRWVIYGEIDGRQRFSAKELIVESRAEALIKDDGPYALIVVQGHGSIGGLAVEAPALISYGEMTQDELFVSEKAAREGVLFRNEGSEPLVTLRYFGPSRK